MSAALGRPRLHLRATTSTNDRARALAQDGAPHGTLVTAGEQRAGRGRQGRTWSAPAGRRCCCRSSCATRRALLPLAAALAVAEVAGPSAHDQVAQRRAASTAARWPGSWPRGARSEGWAVLGIGVNVALRVEELPAELHATAGTLGLTAADLEPTLERLLAAIERALALDPRGAAGGLSRPRRAARAGGRVGRREADAPPGSTAPGAWWSSCRTAGAPR